MEIVQYDLLDHRLISAYDFYVRMFGNANYTQVFKFKNKFLMKFKIDA